jgi:hypothetical protein
VRRGFERLAGKSDAGAFYLTQAMGGGKTHSLIAFGLLAQDPGLRAEVLPQLETGRDFDAANVVISTAIRIPKICSGVTWPTSWAVPMLWHYSFPSLPRRAGRAREKQ